MSTTCVYHAYDVQLLLQLHKAKAPLLATFSFLDFNKRTSRLMPPYRRTLRRLAAIGEGGGLVFGVVRSGRLAIFGTVGDCFRRQAFQIFVRVLEQIHQGLHAVKLGNRASKLDYWLVVSHGKG